MATRKKLFVVTLSEDPALNDAIGQTASKYGIETYGLTWREEPGKPIWGDVAGLAAKNACSGLLLAGDAQTWNADTAKRSHISLAVLKAANLMGGAFTPFIMMDPLPDLLPTPLAGAVPVEQAKLGPRLAAKLGMGKPASPEYFFDVHPLPAGDGLVAELGPAQGGAAWHGALLALTGGGSISHHTVGARGIVPEKGVVEYPMKGLKLEAGGKEFTGWAVANALDADSSYYVRITGEASAFAFGPLPEGDAANLNILTLS